MADTPEIPTLFGWDASDFDWGRGPMDIAAAARDGITFFTHKATEGTSTRHRNYGEALRRARDAGIPVLGAYHVVRTAPTIKAQVDYMLSYLDSQTPWWRDHPHFFIQVDLELWGYDNVPAHVGEQFADAIELACGKVAVIYASRGQYGNQLTGTSHELWNANYGTNPTTHYRTAYEMRGGDTGPGWVTYSGRMPVFWQYGSRTTIGTQNICDANAFRGTLDQLKALVSGGGPTMNQEQADTLNRIDGRLTAMFYAMPTNPYGDGPMKDEANAHQLQLDRIEAKPVSMTDADRAAIIDGVIAGLKPYLPTPAQVADEVGRREAAADRARADVLES